MAEQKTTVSARDVVADIRAGATDVFLMKKYGLSEKGLKSLFQKLITAKVLTHAELDRRASAVEEVEAVIIEEDEVRPTPPASTSTQTVFKCPACNMPQNKEFQVCPQCGIIVEKFLKKIQEQKTHEDQLSREKVEKRSQNITTNEEAPLGPAGTSQLFEETVDIDEAISQPPSENKVPATVRDDTALDMSARKLAKLQEAFEAGILSAAEFEKKQAELIQPQKTSDGLEKLKGLLDAGIITQSEFEAKKADILGQSSKLGKLKEAFEAGILSETEFHQKKSELTGVAVPSSGATQAADTIAQITRPASGPSDADLQAIDPYYMAIFKDIENDKRKPNFYAFLLGVIWYCYKGMWQKGLIYFAAGIVLGELLDIVIDSYRVDLMFTACVNVFYALMANWDYYLYKVHGEKLFTSHWNPLTNKFPLDLPRRVSLG